MTDMRQKLADFITHAGWALMGQPCDCGHNPFNRLAYFVDPWMNAPGAWDCDTDEPRGLARRIVGGLGSRLFAIGCALENAQ